MTRVMITVRDNGSITVEGDFDLTDQAGGKFDLAGRTRISLCRCGLSRNKPFCDSSHKNGAFVSEIRARALPPPPQVTP